MNLCEQVLNLNSAITALCIDCKVGCIIVGVQKEIKCVVLSIFSYF